jgi:hypothetical protein
MTQSDFPLPRKRRRFACDYVPKDDHEARRYAQWVRQNFDREEWDEILDKPRKKQRRQSLKRVINQARKAGERGPVSVTLPDGTIVTSVCEAAIEHDALIDRSEWN